MQLTPQGNNSVKQTKSEESISSNRKIFQENQNRTFFQISSKKDLQSPILLFIIIINRKPKTLRLLGFLLSIKRKFSQYFTGGFIHVINWKTS